LNIAVKNNMDASINIIARSILESLVDFQNLINIPNYRFQLDLKSLNERFKMLSDYKSNPSNPYLSAFNQMDIDKELANTKKMIDDIKKKGIKATHIAVKFDDAKAKDIYSTIYHYFCQDTHGDINNLKAKHLIFMDSQVYINFPASNAIDDYYPLLDMNIRLLVSTAKDINNEFIIFCNEEMQTIEGYLAVLKI